MVLADLGITKEILSLSSKIMDDPSGISSSRRATWKPWPRIVSRVCMASRILSVQTGQK